MFQIFILSKNLHVNYWGGAVKIEKLIMFQKFILSKNLHVNYWGENIKEAETQRQAT